MTHRPFPGAQLLVAALAVSASGCPSLEAEPPRVEQVDDQLATCRVARDPMNPLIVEWPGTSKVDLDSTSKRGLVIVSYAGCALKVLSGCQAEGEYGFQGVTPARDTLAMSTTDELYARLPIGAASLQGEISRGASLDLQYIAVGVRRAESAPTTLRGECAGATHYVDRMTLGAYSLDSVAAGSAGGGVDIAGAGIGGERKESRRRLRQSGELAQCDGKTPTEESELGAIGCGAILQIGLAALPQAAAPAAPEALAPRPVVAPAAPTATPRAAPTPAPRPATPQPARPTAARADSDGDGKPDELDQCPNDPEDTDGFSDEDGCPDPDNDGDGMLDSQDKCPSTPGPIEKGGCA